MTCDRCAGLMLEGDFMDMEESGGMWLRAWRCLNCGYAVDPVMVQNRQRHALLASSHVDQGKSAPNTKPGVVTALAA